MGWGNGPPSWSELERVLSGRAPAVVAGDGGDSPAWTRKREPYAPARMPGPALPVVPYAELHAHSAYSFLDGACLPEELAEEAARLGLTALALTDHNGLYGVVRFAEAAKQLGLPTVFGAELTLGTQGTDAAERAGAIDPAGPHLLVLARGAEGYRRLSRAIAAAHMAGGSKGILRFDLDDLTQAAGGHWHILTGCRKGLVRQALSDSGEDAAEAALQDLVARFGPDRVHVELSMEGIPQDQERNDQLARLAAAVGVPIVAATGAHAARPDQRRRTMALAAVRARQSLDEAAGWLPPAGGGHLRSGDQMSRLFARYPGAVANTVALARECAFDLALIAPKLPPFAVPSGHSEIGWLRRLTAEGAANRYGAQSKNHAAYAQLEHELKVIAQLGFPGYFLVVHDIVSFCKTRHILCQGRGSAANSAVCYAIGITNIDPVANELLFERFLAPERDGPPDIDVDIESDRREEVIQYVYARYGREYTAQVANVITYRGKSAVRDAAKALGYSPGQQDAWSKQVSRWTGVAEESGTGIPPPVLALAAEFEGLPRHLGIHSGGMVICDRPIADVCPTEWARMPGRSVLQWDKDDSAAAGFVKFDLLGLGMLSALQYMIELAAQHKNITIDLAQLDLRDAAVYEMLCRADTVGVFQVESRAQMSTLPRLKPRKFYDIVVEVALIRPGPIQGGSVHPYIRRRNGIDPIVYDHPVLEKALARTLGVPLFQEQLMQIAIDAAGFTAAEADQLRRAMGAKRSRQRMAQLKDRAYQGMQTRHSIPEEVCDRIWEKMCAFADFGFPESHSQSFASLVFYSAWFKLHHPAIFCAGLLRAQPMGFYTPQSLVADARRHGVTVHGPDINWSSSAASVQRDGTEVRLGLDTIRTIGADLADRIVSARQSRGRFASFAELTQAVELTVSQAEALATAGALGSVGVTRRQALWQAGAAARARADQLPLGSPAHTPALPGMSALELAAADIWATGISPDNYPTEFLRARLTELGVITAHDLSDIPDGTRVLVAGAVTHRQRPATARGVTFLSLEDETGLINVVCTTGLWARYRALANSAPALIIRGIARAAEGVVAIDADQLRPLTLHTRTRSRDFR